MVEIEQFLLKFSVSTSADFVFESVNPLIYTPSAARTDDNTSDWLQSIRNSNGTAVEMIIENVEERCQCNRFEYLLRVVHKYLVACSHQPHFDYRQELDKR